MKKKDLKGYQLTIDTKDYVLKDIIPEVPEEMVTSYAEAINSGEISISVSRFNLPWKEFDLCKDTGFKQIFDTENIFGDWRIVRNPTTKEIAILNIATKNFVMLGMKI